MKEAAEQAGKEVTQEFSEEVSEQLAKHSDDVASTSKGISKEEYNSLRKKTPSQDIRDHVNNIDGEKFDPIYGYPVETLEADHIVSMKEITEMDGFASLSDVDKVEVLNFEDNFMGLGKPTNSSKGAKTWSDWQGHSKLGDIPAEIREKMIALEREARTKLQNEIFRRLKNDGSA
ncbi:transposase [Streptococcus oralis subsp. tigurinus]|uniref:Transposase n=2 Tax=Streptococcus oralis TaxID=1303 RepID=A0A1X1FUD3_STROR|nr:transposase [Streptococcus oralis]MCY7078857.1 transposase [Streptococcus oralis]ORO37849.1 transposase [Streptococcus oralis subsp. tigurinus]